MKQYIPYDLEAEESVLGAILIKPDSIVKVLDLVDQSSFYKDQHSSIYKGLISLYNQGNVIDPIVLIDNLKKEHPNINFEDTVLKLLKTVPSAANIASYAKIVKEKAILRRLINSATKIIEMASEPKEEIDKILDKAENEIFRLAQQSEKKDLMHVKDLIHIELQRLEEVYKNKGVVTGISSGMESVDKMMSGFQDSDLVIVAARPSMGKTAFALNLAYNASVVQKKKVLIFSLEMSDAQIFQRLIAIGAHISMSNLKTGFLSQDEWGRIGLVTSRLAESSIYIADVPAITVMEIRALCRRLKAQQGLDMVVIDYIQLIKGLRADNRQQEMSDISRSLKCLARELNIPIIVASQLSRATEQRSDRRPMLSDLRDSGAIEQDADAVLALYRDEYYNEDSQDKGLAEVRIIKQRNGPVGTVKLHFFKEYGRFTSLVKSSN